MKIFIFADPHFCETFSIIQKYGLKYSKRLENQLASLNWVEQTALQNNCQAIVCLGDFFDRPELSDQEITAATEIPWVNEIPHFFLVGNHESGEVNLQFNSTKLLEAPQRTVISEPRIYTLGDTELAFLPYIPESIRRPLIEYFPKTNKKRIIFSHNEIKGIQMGPVISKLGFEVSEIEECCNLFFNGHIHNQQVISNKILNLGNITGKDFGENAFKYPHGALILDTDSLVATFIENPYAFNFYKLEITTLDDFKILESLKPNAVVSIKCNSSLIVPLKNKLSTLDNITEHRVIAVQSLEASSINSEQKLSELTVDHLTRFIECCHINIEASDILEAELAEICK